MKPLNIESTIAKLVNRTVPAQWQAEVEKLLGEHTPSELGTLTRAMEDDAGRLAFLAEYIAHRSGEATCGDRRTHDDAAKAARKQCVRVNKALGYTFAERRTFNL